MTTGRKTTHINTFGYNMTKTELITNLSADTGISKASVTLVVDGLAKAATAKLTAVGEFLMPGVGKLATSHRAAKTGRNPRTGDAVEIPPSVGIKFKPAKTLRDAVN